VETQLKIQPTYTQRAASHASLHAKSQYEIQNGLGGTKIDHL